MTVPLYNLTDTWNNGGTAFTAIKMNVTDTASAVASLLMDLQIGGLSKFTMGKGGDFCAYNTFTDASNYERGVFDWTTTSNTLTIAAQAAGSGTQRDLMLKAGGGNFTVSNFTAVCNLNLDMGTNNITNALKITASYLTRGAPVTKTADFSVVNESYLINNKTGSTCTVTMPSAASYTGREIYFLNYQAQTAVSNASNIVPLAGGAATTALLASGAGKWTKVVSDGTNWVITQQSA